MVLAAGPERAPMAPAGAGLAMVDSHAVTVAGISTATQASQPPAGDAHHDHGGRWPLHAGICPARALLLIEQAGYAPLQMAPRGRPGLDVRLVPNTLGGKVTDSDGQPVGGATISVGGQVTATTVPTAAYTLNGVGADHH